MICTWRHIVWDQQHQTRENWNNANFKGLHSDQIPSWSIILHIEQIHRPNMNTIKYYFHRESAEHILLEEDAYCASRLTGSGGNHQKGRAPCLGGHTDRHTSLKALRPLCRREAKCWLGASSVKRGTSGQWLENFSCLFQIQHRTPQINDSRGRSSVTRFRPTVDQTQPRLNTC